MPRSKQTFVQRTLHSSCKRRLRQPTPYDGSTVTARGLLDNARERLDGLVNQPKRQVMLSQEVSKAYIGLGLYDEALNLATATLEGKNEPSLRWPVLAMIAMAETQKGNLSSAATRFDMALEAILEDPASLPDEKARLLEEAAATQMYLGDLERADELLVEAEALIHESADQLVIADISSTRAGFLHKSGRYVEAAALHRSALQTRVEHLPAPHGKIASTLQNLAWSLSLAGRTQ